MDEMSHAFDLRRFCPGIDKELYDEIMRFRLEFA